MKSHQAVSALKSRPLAVLAAVIVFASLGNALLAGCGGSKSDSSSSTATTETPATTSTPETATPPAGTDAATAGVDGAKIYAERCALCHGPGGHGDGPGAAALNPKPRNHTDGSYMNARTDDQLLEVIRNGKGSMPPWGAVLSDAEIHAVLKHVRTLAVPPYTGS